jgi:hypothetical protein
MSLIAGRLQSIDQGHQMLEDEIDYGKPDCKDYGADQHKQSGALKLLPGRPRSLVHKLYITLFQVIDKLSHLYI